MYNVLRISCQWVHGSAKRPFRPTFIMAAGHWVYSFAALTNSKRFGARLTPRLNRKFLQTDDTTQDSEETATAFTVSKSSHNSRTKLANPRIKIVARSLWKLLVFVALQPLSSYSWNTHTCTHTHTVSFTVSLVRLRLEAYLAKRQQKIIPELTCAQLE